MTGRNTHLLLWLGITCVYVLLRINTLSIPLDRDEGVFGLIGQTILNGGLPYADGIDNKPPLVFFLFASFLAFFPATATSIHIGLQIYNFFSLIILFLVAKKLDGYSLAYWSAFIYAILSINPYLQGFTASTEMFLLLPLLVSFLAGLFAVEADRPKYFYVFLSGMFAALACWFKQPAVFSVLGVCIILCWILVSRDTTRALRNLSTVFVVWLLGGVLVSIVISIYFYANDIFFAFYYWSIEHPVFYSASIPLLRKVSLFWAGLSDLVGNSSLVFLLAAAAMLISDNKVVLRRLLFVMFLLSLGAAVLGFGFAHYFAQLLPALCLLSALSICYWTRGALSKQNIVKKIAVAVVLLAVTILPNQVYHLDDDAETFSREFFHANPFPESIAIAEYLKANTLPEDLVFILGSEPQILLLADRRSATPFFVVYPLFQVAFPRYLEFQEQVASDVTASEPAFIVIVNLQQSLNFDGKAELPIFTFVADYTARHYSLERAYRYDEVAENWVPDSEYDLNNQRASIALYHRRSE